MKKAQRHIAAQALRDFSTPLRYARNDGRVRPTHHITWRIAKHSDGWHRQVPLDDGKGIMAVHHRRPGRMTRRGFSLIEILFAVLILTTGMIFVAMQFPVGLANSRKQVDETLKVINTHNAKIMLELQLGAISSVVIKNEIPPNKDMLIMADGNIHLLPKVNLLANDFTNGRQTVIVDDPENMLDLGAPQNYTNTSLIDFFPPYITIDSSKNLNLGNLGKIMSPAVGESDSEVEQILFDKYSPPYTDVQINDEIFKVALTRTYSWCALYKSIDQNNIRFYIFTLRKGKNAYAMQNDATTAGSPVVFPVQNAMEDRVYPVPWLVDLNNGSGIPSAADNTRNFIGSGTKNAPQYIAPREFLLDAAFADLFQEGTIFIDADLEVIDIIGPPEIDWENNGYVYEVMEITPDGSDYLLRLRKPLEDDLNFIWIIPPAYDRSNGGEFGEVDPVVDVAEQVIRF